jgi:hypothetical protein
LEIGSWSKEKVNKKVIESAFTELTNEFRSNSLLDADFASLSDICQYMLKFRSRIEPLRGSTIKVMTPTGEAVFPRYFECVLNEERWPVVARNIEIMSATVDMIMTSHQG